MAADLPAAGDAATLYVLDLSGYVFRAYHALPPMSSSKGEPTNAVLGVTQMLLKLVQQQRPRLLAVAMDSRGPSFRKDRYPAYKANRPPPPPDLSQQMERCRQVVEAYGIPTFAQAGAEADDLIATLVHKARERDLKVVVVSADKDLLQLVGDGVLMFDSMRGRVFDAAETEAKLGVPPQQVRDLLALTGDASDNVPGVPSVGPKTAQALLAEFGDLDGIYAHLADVKRVSLRKKLEENRDSAYLSRDLVTLLDRMDLEFDVDALRFGGADTAALRSLFVELEFERLLKELDAAGAKGPSGAAAGADPGDALDARGTAGTATGPASASAIPVDILLTTAQLDALAARLRAAGALSFYLVCEPDDARRGLLVGLAFSSDGERAAYIPIGHSYLGMPAQLGLGEVLKSLGGLLGDPAYPKRCADLKEATAALKAHGQELVGVDMDTMLASYVLDPERRGHGIEEVARTALDLDVGPAIAPPPARGRGNARQPAGTLSQVPVEDVAGPAGLRAAVVQRATSPLRARAERDGVLSLLTDLELPLAEVLAEMEMIGFRLDVALLVELGKEVDEELHRLEGLCHELAGGPFNVASPRQLETILFDQLGLPVIKKTKTARSTDHAVLEELAPLHALPRTILDHRTLAKLKSTYLDTLPRQIDAKTGRVHTRINQAVAATGRLSSSDPNLQNIPIRTELGARVRNAFIAREGWSILSADYSQIELRVLAHLSGDEALVEAFQQEADVHQRTAQALFGVAAEAVTREMRGQAKTVNFAVIYGQTEFALARNLGIERREAARYIEAFFVKYAGVSRYMEALVEEARSQGEVRTLLGRRRRLPDIHSKNRGLRQAAERIARNTPIQGSAADIMKLAMVRIHRELADRKLESRMLLTVHDELIFEVPPAEREEMADLVREQMARALPLSVPLVVDQGFGASWGEAH